MSLAGGGEGARLVRLACWAVLVALLALTALGALLMDRSDWPAMVGDEPTYAMQAASLAWDADLLYERRDYDRFLAQWGHPPENLILQSTDGGERITFSKPFFFALAAAPWLRLAPRNGAALANVFFLALAALASARTLERRIGPLAALWVAVFIFASVAFVYSFWVHADLFLMSLTALGLALVFRTEHAGPRQPGEIYDLDLEEPLPRLVLRWSLAGALLAVPAAVRPFHLVLLLAVTPALPRRRFARALASLVAGAGLVLGVGLLVHQASGGAWMGYGSERQGFYSYTGYPDVDFPRQEWSRSIERWGNTSWVHEGAFRFQLDGHLWAWNGLYLLLGQDVGLLPYFLPLVLGLAAFTGGRLRWWLLAAALVVWGCFFLVRPFNFWGGSGAVANRYFLPLYPVFWFLAGRRLRPAWLVAVVLLAGAFLWPLWRRPLAYPLGEQGGYRHVTELARRFLPYETTQSHLKPSGQEDVQHNGLWIKFLTRTVGAQGDGEALLLRPGGAGRFLLGSPEPLAAVRLELESTDGSKLELRGGDLREMMIRPDGSIVWEVGLEGHLRAQHPMWWTWDRFFLYELELELENGGDGELHRFWIEPGRLRSEPVRGAA